MLKVKRTSIISGESTEFAATIIDQSESQICVDWDEPNRPTQRKWLPRPHWGKLSGRFIELELVQCD